MPGQSVQANTPAFTVVDDLSHVQLQANVDESEVTKVSPGQKATFSFDAYPGQVFEGKVTSVRKSAQNYQNVVTFPVVIDAVNPDRKMFPGMTASVRIVTAERADVTKIPRAALRFRPAKGDASHPITANQETIYGVASGRLQPHVVRTGISDGIFVEMIEGDLKPGDNVVVGIAEGDESGKNAVKVGPLKF